MSLWSVISKIVAVKKNQGKSQFSRIYNYLK